MLKDTAMDLPMCINYIYIYTYSCIYSYVYTRLLRFGGALAGYVPGTAGPPPSKRELCAELHMLLWSAAGGAPEL